MKEHPPASYKTDVIASYNSLVGSVSLMKVMKYPTESRVGICLTLADAYPQLSASEWQNTSAVVLKLHKK